MMLHVVHRLASLFLFVWRSAFSGPLLRPQVKASLLPSVSESVSRLLLYSRDLFALLLHINDNRLQILQQTWKSR